MPRYYEQSNFSPIPFAALTAIYDAALDRTKKAMDMAHCVGMPCIDILAATIPDTSEWGFVRLNLEREVDYREELKARGE